MVIGIRRVSVPEEPDSQGMLIALGQHRFEEYTKRPGFIYPWTAMYGILRGGSSRILDPERITNGTVPHQ